MTILALAYSGLKTLNKLLFTPNPYESVEHLNDNLLHDIGMYREAGKIFNNSAITVEIKHLDKEQDVNDTVVFIPHYLKDSSS
ncbi:MAG: molybdopterin converting factor small subunit [Oceanospirillaceae bacterium]|jgi:molybdopterin converting factor small subunit